MALLIIACAGMQAAPKEALEFDEIVEAPNWSKDSLYDGIKVWVAETFHSAKAVIEIDNKEQGLLIGNGIIPYPCSGLDCTAKYNWNVLFTIRAETKDNKYRLAFSNLRLGLPASTNTVTGFSPASEPAVWSQSDIDVIKPKLLAFGNDIKASLGKSAAKSNW